MGLPVRCREEVEYRDPDEAVSDASGMVGLEQETCPCHMQKIPGFAVSLLHRHNRRTVYRSSGIIR